MTNIKLTRSEFDPIELMVYVDSIKNRVSIKVNKESWLPPITFQFNFKYLNLMEEFYGWMIIINVSIDLEETNELIKELLEAKEIAKRLNELMFNKKSEI